MGAYYYPDVDAQVDVRRHSGTTQAGQTNLGVVMMYMDGHAKFTILSQSVAVPGNVWTMLETD